MGAVTAAVIGGAAAVGSGVMAKKEAKKNRRSAEKMQQKQEDLMRQQMDNFRELTDKLPDQTRQMIKDMSKSYVEVRAMLDQAKVTGDKQSAALFEEQRNLVRTHLDAELEAIGLQTDEFVGQIDQLTDNALKLVREDADFNEQLKETYRTQSKDALGNLKKMADASGQRVDSILKTGLAPEAAAKISKIQQGVSDLTRKTAALEAKVGKGGSASRITATELEGLKVLGEVTADLQANAQDELAKAGQVQGQYLAAAGEVADRSQTTRGREELAARQPYDQAKLNARGLEAQQSLTAINNANVETRRLTGAEGEASLAREDQYTRDRMSLVQNEAAAKQSLQEREQDLQFQGASMQAGQANSMADVMGVQAQNYANMAKESSAAATQSFMNLGRGVVGGLDAAWTPGGKGAKGSMNWGNFAGGSLKGMFGVS